MASPDTGSKVKDELGGILLCFLPLLIKPDLCRYQIRLSDWLYPKAQVVRKIRFILSARLHLNRGIKKS